MCDNITFMRRGLLCLLTLTAALPAAAREHRRPPPPPRPPALIAPRQWNPAEAISDGSATCGACRTTTARFLVTYEYHSGFTLRRENDFYAIVWLVFASDPAREMFSAYLAPNNMRALVGQRIYCDCTGIAYTIGDATIFRLTDARLFAQ